MSTLLIIAFLACGKIDFMLGSSAGTVGFEFGLA
jgi:hypothetical protein